MFGFLRRRSTRIPPAPSTNSNAIRAELEHICTRTQAIAQAQVVTREDLARLATTLAQVSVAVQRIEILLNGRVLDPPLRTAAEEVGHD